MFDHLHIKHTKFTEEKMLNMIEDIALGMTYLHGRSVLHCYLKSSNILVITIHKNHLLIKYFQIDSNWDVKLCDFGLSRAKYKIKDKRKNTMRVGTPHWMAPEIMKGEKYDEASDVYSFGMILWLLV